MTRAKPLKKMEYIVLTSRSDVDNGILYCEICHGTLKLPHGFCRDSTSFFVRGFQEQHKKCRSKHAKKDEVIP
jgi:hypothetical protein